ncbi:hypothetical protein [Nitrosophilus kaiyonis]|uniref:hypothetical protein n=1 Tax=Nitrosophilus kaiyonis TaxID=2930200 RepID=UPI00249317FD|nr:hypothetical protein [Nitrosophilus kaiyonis]
MLIEGAKFFEDSKFKSYDIEIEEGKILKKISSKKESNIFVIPPLVDLNIKPLDDKVNALNLKNLANAAKKSGVLYAALNPQIEPSIDNEIILEFIKSQDIKINILPLLNATKDEKSLTEIAILLKKGANSIYFNSDIDSFLISRIFEYAKMYGVTLHCRAQNSSIKNSGVMHEGKVSSKLGLSGISEIEEISEVAKIIEFSKYYNVPVLFKSLSSSRSIEIIQKAKEEGIKVYSEVSIYHLTKTDEECSGYNTYFKIDPPLRDEKNRKKLIEYLKNGYIDTITSLHSPKSNVLKDVSFDEAAYGIDSIENYLVNLYETFVEKNIINFEDLIKYISLNPSKIAKIENFEKNFIVFDTKNKEIININSDG